MNFKEYLDETQNKKSKHASEVLQLMDKDFSYQDALKKVLKKYPKLDKKELEKELDKYI